MKRLRNFRMNDLSTTVAVLITIAVITGLIGTCVVAAFTGSAVVFTVGALVSVSPWLVDAFNESL